jgi:hypothetical protein
MRLDRLAAIAEKFAACARSVTYFFLAGRAAPLESRDFVFREF